MAEDNNKNSKQTKATKNAFVNAAKMHGGPLGAGVNLASKTKLGNAVLNKGAEAFNKQNPVAGRLAGALNKGNSDLINNKKNDSKSNPAQAQESSKSSTGAGGGLGSLLNNKSKSKTSGNASDEQLNGDGEVSGDFAAFVGRILKKHWPKVAAISAGALLFLIIIIAVYLIVASIAGGVIEFFGDIGDALVGFFKLDEQELIEKYYDELDKVQEDLRNRYNVCIDVNLITATLTVDLDAAEYADNIDNPPKGDVSAGEDEGASSEVEETEKDYKKMTKEVGLLGSMQIKRKIYGRDSEVVEGDCLPEGQAKEELVSEENLGRLLPAGWWDRFIANFRLNDEKKKEKYVSDNPDLVSRHDLNSFQKFFTKKINEEKNYEYYIYSQAYQEKCDDNGQNCQLVCKKDLVPGDGEDIPTLSIGDLKTMDESVYYWNLVNSFIPNYYERYLPASGEARDKAIKKIAEKIYLLYNDLGPNANCVSPQQYICHNDEGSEYYAGGSDDSFQSNEWIEKYAPLAIDEMSRTGTLASVTLAQAIVESSRNGKIGGSMLSRDFKNYYGMTAGSCAYKKGNKYNKNTVYPAGIDDNTCEGNAYWNGSAVHMCNSKGTDCQWYRVYDNLEMSTKDHSRWVAAHGCNVYSDPESVIDCIQRNGYATATSYKKSLLSTIKKYNLTQYDIGEWDNSYIEETEQQYTNSVCFYGANGSEQIGDWANWKQYDSKWSGTKLSGCTLGSVGCYVTSIAILIAKSGAPTTLGANFNPGTFASHLSYDRSCNYSGGFSDIQAIVPSFKSYDPSYDVTPIGIANKLREGYYLQIYITKANGRPHFVAVNKVVGDTIYIYDPGSTCTTLNNCYPGSRINNIRLYRIGG